MSIIGNFLAIDPADLDDLIDDPDEVEDYLYPPDEDEASFDDALCIDKAWHAIHYLLTGSIGSCAGPLGLVVSGGTEIGYDLGYGPACFLTPEEVKIVASELASIPTDAFASRFKRSVLEEAKIYPLIWDQADARAYVVSHYARLSRYYCEAADRGDAMLIYMT